MGNVTSTNAASYKVDFDSSKCRNNQFATRKHIQRSSTISDSNYNTQNAQVVVTRNFEYNQNKGRIKESKSLNAENADRIRKPL